MGTIISGVLEILCHFFKMKQTGDDPFTTWNIAVFIHPFRIHSGNANDMYIFIGQSYFLYLLYKEGDYYATENPFTCDALSGIGKSIYDAEELPSCFDEFSTFVRGCAENSPTGRA